MVGDIQLIARDQETDPEREGLVQHARETVL